MHCFKRAACIVTWAMGIQTDDPNSIGGKPRVADENGDDGGDLFASDDEADHEVAARVDGAAEAPANDDRRDARQAENFRKATTGLNDMYDDSQGYYNFRVGEVMGSRYASVQALDALFSCIFTLLFILHLSLIHI